MVQASVLTLCTVCLLLVGSFAQPTQGPSASAGAQSGASAPGPASSRVETRPLTAFSRVAVCTPFTVLVQPSTQYQITIDADDAVKQATTTLIDGDTLLVEANSFTTTNPIKVTVGLPSTALSAIIARGTFPALVAPGFSAAKLSITSSGTSQLNVLGISVGELTFVVSGTGSPVVTGNITTLRLKNTGTGNAYVSGVNTSATIESTGTGSIYVLTTGANVQLTGTSTGLGKVVYNQGTCSITGQSWVFGPTCQQTQFSMPDTSLSWSCGIVNTGRAACSGGSSSVSTTTANCPNSPVTYPAELGQVNSYSLIDSKTGTALGLDTNTPTAQAGGTAGGSVAGTPLTVNGLANGVNNSGTQASTNGQGNGQGSVGAGNGNQNGNGNAGGLNGNGNGIGNVGNGNGSNNGNGNTNTQG
ncbi:g2396 [Coccomyxa elongata]